MKTYTAAQGEHIHVTATSMVNLANQSGEEVQCKFGESMITVKPGNSPEEIVDQYWSKAPERQ